MKQAKKGAITLFVTLVFFLVLAFILSVLELAHQKLAQTAVMQDMDHAMEAVFAGYDEPLFEVFGLLMKDVREEDIGETLNQMVKLMTETNRGLKERTDWLYGKPQPVQFTAFMATDDEGAWFSRSVWEVMKYDALDEIADTVRELAKNLRRAENARTDKDWEEVITKFPETKQEPAAPGEDQDGKIKNWQEEWKGFAEKDPVKFLRDYLLDTPASLFTDDKGRTLSEKKLTGEKPSDLLAGKEADWATEKDPVKRIALIEYILSYLASYASETKGEALSYELEYVIAGFTEDQKNLRDVAKKLWFMRTNCDLLFLETHPEYKKEASYAAKLLTAWTGQAGITAAAEQAFLLAWATGEGLLDVRTLLKGQKVSLVKTTEEWTTHLGDVVEYISSSGCAKACEKGGLCYTDYLRVLLYTEENDTSKLYRAMDMIEGDMQVLHEGFCFSKALCGLSCRGEFLIPGVFVNFTWFQKLLEKPPGFTHTVCLSRCY